MLQTKICEAIKKDFIDFDVRRVIGGQTPNYGHSSTPTTDVSECLEYEYTKYFCVDSHEFAINVGYYYLDIEFNGCEIKAEHLEYKAVNAHCRVKKVSTRRSEVKSFEDFVDGFDSNSKEFKTCLKSELEFARFPEEIIEKIISSDLSQGYFLHEPSLHREHSKLSIVPDFFPDEHSDHVVIVLDKSWKDFDNYNQHNDYLAGLLETWDIVLDRKALAVENWIDENCSDNVYVVGDCYSWQMLIFENKQDALLWKLTFMK